MGIRDAIAGLFRENKPVKALISAVELKQIETKLIQMQNDYNSHLLDLNQNLQAMNTKLSMRESRQNKKQSMMEDVDPFENLQPGQKV